MQYIRYQNSMSNTLGPHLEGPELVVPHAGDVLAQRFGRRVGVLVAERLDDQRVLVDRRRQPARDLGRQAPDPGEVSAQVVDQGAYPAVRDLVEQKAVELVYRFFEVV